MLVLYNFHHCYHWYFKKFYRVGIWKVRLLSSTMSHGNATLLWPCVLFYPKINFFIFSIIFLYFLLNSSVPYFSIFNFLYFNIPSIILRLFFGISTLTLFGRIFNSFHLQAGVVSEQFPFYPGIHFFLVRFPRCVQHGAASSIKFFIHKLLF